MANLPEADYANLDKLNAAIASDPTFHYLSLHANNGDQQSIQALEDLAASKGFPVPDNVTWGPGGFQNIGGSIPTWMKIAAAGTAGLATLGLVDPLIFGAEGGAEAAGAGGGAAATGAGTTAAVADPFAAGAAAGDTAASVGAGTAAGAAGGASGAAAGGGAAAAGGGFLSGLSKVAGPLIGGAFGLAGAALQAHSASDAAKANAQIQQEALDFEKAQLAQKQAALQPYVDTGNQSRGQLSYLLGIGPNNGPNPISTNTPPPTAAPPAPTSTGQIGGIASGFLPSVVQMKDPNGMIESVPASQVNHYLSLGATLVNA